MRQSDPIDGIVVLALNVHKDSRGSFCETWRDSHYEEYGIKERFIQDNISHSRQNILRGLHAQLSQGQLLTVITGTIFDVIVDIRPESSTYKDYFAIKLSAEDGKQLYMPPGFAHGFCVISENAILHYKCSQYYNQRQEFKIIYNDPDIGIDWPNLSGADYIISESDLAAKPLQEIINTL